MKAGKTIFESSERFQAYFYLVSNTLGLPVGLELSEDRHP